MTPYWKIKNKIRSYRRNEWGVFLDPEVSVFSSNCTGSLYLHEHHMRFNSPFVNLWIRPSDYIRMLNNLDYYLSQSFVFVDDENKPYPVGMLGDVKIFFQHYKSKEDAVKKWTERCERINKEKIRVIMVQRGQCTYEDLQAFENLPYKYKVCFTYKDYPELSSMFHIRGFEKKGKVGDLYEFEGVFSFRKYYDQFKMDEFINGQYW